MSVAVGALYFTLLPIAVGFGVYFLNRPKREVEHVIKTKVK